MHNVAIVQNPSTWAPTTYPGFKLGRSCVDNDLRTLLPREEWPITQPVTDHIALKELRDSLQMRLTNQLTAAFYEATDIDDPSIIPLTAEAENACTKLASTAADTCFYAEWIQMMATAKLDGGASFVGRNPKNLRRIDVEISPNGDTAQFVATERARTISAFDYDLDEDLFRRWLNWLLPIA